MFAYFSSGVRAGFFSSVSNSSFVARSTFDKTTGGGGDKDLFNSFEEASVSWTFAEAELLSSESVVRGGFIVRISFDRYCGTIFTKIEIIHTCRICYIQHMLNTYCQID